MLSGRAELEAERERTPEITVETRAVEASLASSEETRAKAPPDIAVPQRARGMPPPPTKVGEIGKSALSMFTRGRTVTPAAGLPAPAQASARGRAKHAWGETQTHLVQTSKAQKRKDQHGRPNCARSRTARSAPTRRPCHVEEDERVEKVV